MRKKDKMFLHLINVVLLFFALGVAISADGDTMGLYLFVAWILVMCLCVYLVIRRA